ncbi:MAG TPA: response regulator transcription factor [Solirubrobacteraceae bacterium]|jgi:DNA-binding NarL/FixJ family response regulator|nr:response regulator transcription factor [Solirubrobacteraceae bacterium]
MIRILIVDDHPALRAGLTAVLRSEPGLVPLDAASSVSDLWPALKRTKPDVVVLDYHLPGDDGIVVCRRIKRELPAPAVLLYSAYADASLTIPALLAGVDGLVSKSAPANELYDAIRRVARGERVLPPISRQLLDAAGSELEPDELPILGMTLEETPLRDMAAALGVEPVEVAHRIDRMIKRLKVEIPAPRGAG